MLSKSRFNKGADSQTNESEAEQSDSDLIKASPGNHAEPNLESVSRSAGEAAVPSSAAQEVWFFRQQLQDAQLRITDLQIALKEAGKASAGHDEVSLASDLVL